MKINVLDNKLPEWQSPVIPYKSLTGMAYWLVSGFGHNKRYCDHLVKSEKSWVIFLRCLINERREYKHTMIRNL